MPFPVKFSHLNIVGWNHRVLDLIMISLIFFACTHAQWRGTFGSKREDFIDNIAIYALIGRILSNKFLLLSYSKFDRNFVRILSINVVLFGQKYSTSQSKQLERPEDRILSKHIDKEWISKTVPISAYFHHKSIFCQRYRKQSTGGI